MGAISVARAGTIAKPTAGPPFVPTDIAGMKVWFDATQITGKNDGDAISQWDDLSGNAKHATQATGGKQPTYQTGEINSKPVVQFDGTDDALGIDLNNTDSSITVISVGRFRSGAASGGRIWGMPGNTSIFHNNTEWGYYAGEGFAVKSLGGTLLSATLFVCVFASDSSVTIYRDGTSVQTFDPQHNYDDTTDLALGASTTGSEYGKCQIAEFLMYDSPLGTTDRDNLESYLGTKWGITIA